MIGRRNSLFGQRGFTMVSALIFLSAMSALAAAYAMNVRATIGLRGAAGARRSAFYAAEAGLNVGIAGFAEIFRNSGVPQGHDFDKSVTIAGKQIDVDLAAVTGCDPCDPSIIPEGEVFAGLHTIPYRYTVQSVSKVRPGDSTAHVAGEFDIHNIPIFQFLAFIDSHLFIMPLPDMTLHGRLHTNDDLYIQPDNTLKIQDMPPVMPNVQVTSAGDIFRGGRKYNDSWRCWGTAVVDKLEDTVAPSGDLDPKTMLCDSTDPLPDETLSGWNGSIKSKVRNIVTPPVEIIDRGSGPYWKKADLRIVLNLNSAPLPIDFSAGDLCPAGAGTMISPPLFPIEVHEASGLVDPAKTRQLLRFMCERRGALFYTDVPINAPTPPANNWVVPADPTRYLPNFATAATVYRRVGEDTSGDGDLTNRDRNDDICPVGGAVPWWRPPSCPFIPAPGAPTSWYRDMDYRRGGFWNHREEQWMMLLNLNLRALIEWNDVNGEVLFDKDDRSQGGLVFFLSVVGPQSNATRNNYGVRVFDSADLDMRDTTFAPGVFDPTGVTVVSDQSAIVQGNYNTHDKFPAAVLADAIWILSQGWEVPLGAPLRPNDLKSVFNLDTDLRDVPTRDWPGGAGGRAAFDTSSALGVNAALLFGLGPSTRDDDWYNGGLENFPKFLESWRSRTFNYEGSFVSLGEPQHKDNNWKCGSGNSCNGSGVYDPPVRAYDYDTDFNLVENLPPMTPKVVYVQQRIYTRLYD